MVDSKLTMGREMSEETQLVPREGRLSGFAASLCVGGLVVGLLSASFYQWGAFLTRHG